jgi:hypothetical protein
VKALDANLERLATLSPVELRGEWQVTYGEDAPAISPALLRLGIAYRWQEKVVGKLPVRMAKRLAGHGEAGTRSAPISLSPGTQLVRSWNGRTLSVVVTETGFSFEDRSYRSLSAIAREVTGTAWSGPRFFGLDGGARHG